MTKNATLLVEDEEDEEELYRSPIFVPDSPGKGFGSTLKRKKTRMMTQRAKYLDEMRLELGLEHSNKK